MISYGIILASGTGSRYGGDLPKQFVKIAGKTVFEHTVDVFENSPFIDSMIVVVTPGYRSFAEELIRRNNYRKIIKLLDGGATRKESSGIGVSAVEEAEAKVIIHDCARPFLPPEIIGECVNALDKYDAVNVAIPSVDTIIKVNGDFIDSIPERKFLRRVQTPQCFKLSTIRKAHELSGGDDNFTDDCGMIVTYGLGKVYIVNGSAENIKITYPEDVHIADKIFAARQIKHLQQLNLTTLKGKVIVFSGDTLSSLPDIANQYGARVCIGNGSSMDLFLKQVYSENGKIDYVVLSAGNSRSGKLLDRTPADLKGDIDGTINAVRAALPYWQKTPGSFLLFAADNKTAVPAVNLVGTLAEELGETGIKINAFTGSPELSTEDSARASLRILLSDLTGRIIDGKSVGS
jgi:2-C-methyl-D-erythritol 4-phosphate cytidylyltransferase